MIVNTHYPGPDPLPLCLLLLPSKPNLFGFDAPFNDRRVEEGLWDGGGGERDDGVRFDAFFANRDAVS